MTSTSPCCRLLIFPESFQGTGKVSAYEKVERTLPMILQWDENFDIGSDTLTGVNYDDYQPPFPLAGQAHDQGRTAFTAGTGVSSRRRRGAG